MSRKSLCCIAPSPAYVRRGCLSLPSNYGSSSSSSQPRTSWCGIQSLYFRTGVTEVLARFVILWVLYTGMQWKCLPVPKDHDGKAEIHYTTVYKVFAKWSDDGSLEEAFIASVAHLADHNHLDLSVLHGDGTNTVAKKGGDGIGYSGHKHQKGEKVI